MFESGRPVLIVPPQPPATLGERIAIAWNGTTDTARSIAFAMPLLMRAEDVVISDRAGTRAAWPKRRAAGKASAPPWRSGAGRAAGRNGFARRRLARDRRRDSARTF